MTSIFSFQSW